MLAESFDLGLFIEYKKTIAYFYRHNLFADFIFNEPPTLCETFGLRHGGRIIQQGNLCCKQSIINKYARRSLGAN